MMEQSRSATAGVGLFLDAPAALVHPVWKVLTCSTITLLAVVLVCVLPANAAGHVPFAEELAGDALIVVDGDTVALPCKPESGNRRGCAIKVRLKDIDTPEVAHPTCEHELVKGLEARARLRELISGEAVTVRHSGKTDRYGRSLGWLTLQDGSDIGAILLKEGLALNWHAGSTAKAGRIAHWCGASQ